MKRVLFLIACLSITITAIFGQTNYSLLQGDSKIKVEGTSNVHDWEMHATDFRCSLKMILEIGNVSSIEDVSFRMPVKSLVSESNIMDKKTWEALDAKKHDQIKFTFERLSDFENIGGSFQGIALGSLNIAGVKKNTSIQFKGEVCGQNKVKISGEKVIELKDFNIAPPTAMMGAMKTGDKVTVNFIFEFQPENGYSGK